MHRAPSDEYKRYLPPDRISIINGYPIRIDDMVLYEVANLLPNFLMLIKLLMRWRPSCAVVVNPLLALIMRLWPLRRAPIVLDFADYYPLLLVGKDEKLPNILRKLIVFVAKLITDLALKVCDTVVACSPGLFYYALVLRAGKETYLIPNGIEHLALMPIHGDPREKYNLCRDDFVVCYIGGLRFLDIELMVDGLRELHSSGIKVKLLVAGDGPQLPELRERLRKEGLLANAVFLGRVPKKEVPKVIRAADVCIIPFRARRSFSLWLFPLKLLDYLAQCKPVISTPLYGLDEVLGREALRCVAFVLSPGELARAAQEFCALMNDPSFLRCLKAVQQNILRNLAWEAVSERFCEIVYCWARA